MEHVVFFPSADGSPAFRRVSSLEDAVRLVEHLRNVEGVGEVSVHALTEVPLAFRAYYRVEVPGAEAAAVVPVAPVAAAEAQPALALVPDAEPQAELAPEHAPEAAPELVETVPVEQAEVPQPEPAVARHEMPPVDLPVQEARAEDVVPAPEPAHAHGRRSLGFFSS